MKVKIIYKGEEKECEVTRKIFLQLEREGLGGTAIRLHPLEVSATFAKLALGAKESVEELFDDLDLDAAGDAFSAAAEEYLSDSAKKKKVKK